MLTTASEVDYRWTPGDTVGILTRNSDEDVDSLVDHLELQSIQHKLYRVEVDPATKKKGAKVPVYIPKLVPLSKLFAECLDLKSIPKKVANSAQIKQLSTTFIHDFSSSFELSSISPKMTQKNDSFPCSAARIVLPLTMWSSRQE